MQLCRHVEAPPYVSSLLLQTARQTAGFSFSGALIDIGEFGERNYYGDTEFAETRLHARRTQRIHGRQNQTPENERKGCVLFHTSGAEENRTNRTDKQKAKTVRDCALPVFGTSYRGAVGFGMVGY